MRDTNLRMCTSNENGGERKIWLSPVQLTRTGGYSAAELGRIIRIVRENRAHLLEAWNEYFA
jgi:hypothetical protein